MSETFRLRIDLPKLATNLSTAEGQELSEADARAFLTKHQFVPLGGDVWMCEEVGLRLQNRSEMLELEGPR